MKYPVIILCLVLGVLLGLLSGCSEPAPLEGSTSITKGYDVICLNGIQYWKSPSHNIAPKYSAGIAGIPHQYPDGC